MSILDISKTLMYEVWFDYIKLKYQDNAKLCYVAALLFILKLKIFTKTFLRMLKNSLTHLTMMRMNAISLLKDHFQYVKTKK